MRAIQLSGLGLVPGGTLDRRNTNPNQHTWRRAAAELYIEPRLSPLQSAARARVEAQKANAPRYAFNRSVGIETCGAGGIPCNMASPVGVMQGSGGVSGLSRGLGGLGTIEYGCAPLKILLDQLSAALSAAKDAGVDTGSSAYLAAKAFVDSNTGFLHLRVITDDASCKAFTDTANAHIAAVGALIDSKSAGAGAAFTQGPQLTPNAGGDDLSSTIKTVAIAAAIIAGAVVAAPIVYEVIGGIHRLVRR